MTHLRDPVATDRVLLLVPHPDDEVLAAGVLLLRAVRAGAEVKVVVATDGEKNGWVQRIAERRVRIGDSDRERLGHTRRNESIEALARLGVRRDQIAFFGLPDQGLTDLLLTSDEHEIRRWTDLVEGFRPTLFLSPSPLDWHPDHSALGVLSRIALDRVEPTARPATTLEFVVHGPRAPTPFDGLVRVEPSEDEKALKDAALRAYATPYVVHRGMFKKFVSDPETFIVPGTESSAADVHPVRNVRVVDGDFQFEIVDHARLGAFGPSSLFLLSDCKEVEGRVLSTRLPRSKGASDLWSVSTGRTCARVRSDRVHDAGHGARHVSLPQSALPPATRRFVKIERRFGFYDEGGWLEIAAGECTARELAEVSLERFAPDVCAIVPCFDIAALCGRVVRETAQRVGLVIAIDDGSSDSTLDELRAAAAEFDGRVQVISFPENRGKGAALLEGLRAGLAAGDHRVFLTIDGDGQHPPCDLPRLVAACRAGADLVVGQRTKYSRMPLRSRFGNGLTRAILHVLCPGCPADTQCGYRALSRSFADEVVRCVPEGRYETELHMLLLALRERHRVESVSIPTLYLRDNRSSHFRPLVDSVRIYRTLITRTAKARRPAKRI